MTDSDDFPASARNRSTFDATKARRAAKDPERPGEKCRASPSAFEPKIDRSRCEGKADCAAVCPYDVFEVGRIDDADFNALSFLGRLKSRAHRRMTAYTPRADACQACGLCVVACPEDAITLVRREGRS
jgi:NAD-dependent dihydropyrimidine dehydrogenase PreA subunit